MRKKINLSELGVKPRGMFTSEETFVKMIELYENKFKKESIEYLRGYKDSLDNREKIWGMFDSFFDIETLAKWHAVANVYKRKQIDEELKSGKAFYI